MKLLCTKNIYKKNSIIYNAIMRNRVELLETYALEKQNGKCIALRKCRYRDL